MHGHGPLRLFATPITRPSMVSLTHALNCNFFFFYVMLFHAPSAAFPNKTIILSSQIPVGRPREISRRAGRAVRADDTNGSKFDRGRSNGFRIGIFAALVTRGPFAYLSGRCFRKQPGVRPARSTRGGGGATETGCRRKTGFIDWFFPVVVRRPANPFFRSRLQRDARCPSRGPNSESGRPGRTPTGS